MLGASVRSFSRTIKCQPGVEVLKLKCLKMRKPEKLKSRFLLSKIFVKFNLAVTFLLEKRVVLISDFGEDGWASQRIH